MPVALSMVIGRVGFRPILPVKWSVIISTMLNVDGDEHSDGVVGRCKHSLRIEGRLNVNGLSMSNFTFVTPFLSFFMLCKQGRQEDASCCYDKQLTTPLMHWVASI